VLHPVLPGTENHHECGVEDADVVRQKHPAGCGSGGVFIGEVSPFMGEVPRC
jgi:hypothetical protein